jgi:hypothetical protein
LPRGDGGGQGRAIGCCYNCWAFPWLEVCPLPLAVVGLYRHVLRVLMAGLLVVGHKFVWLYASVRDLVVLNNWKSQLIVQLWDYESFSILFFCNKFIYFGAEAFLKTRPGFNKINYSVYQRLAVPANADSDHFSFWLFSLCWLQPTTRFLAFAAFSLRCSAKSWPRFGDTCSAAGGLGQIFSISKHKQPS